MTTRKTDDRQQESARRERDDGAAAREGMGVKHGARQETRKERVERRFRERELGGRDPLDPAFERVPDDLAAPADRAAVPDSRLQRLARRLRTHAAFGLAPALAPAMVFVPLGYLLGPSGLNVLPAYAIQHLDPVISVGLAALGMFVGLALGRRPLWEPRLFLAASVEAMVTVRRGRCRSPCRRLPSRSRSACRRPPRLRSAARGPARRTRLPPASRIWMTCCRSRSAR
jgi:hypothetical protein